MLGPPSFFVFIPFCAALLRSEQRASRPVVFAGSSSVASVADRGIVAARRIVVSPADRGAAAASRVNGPPCY
jgi:hypothetical protein